jgi:hypothetical protein
MTQDIILFRRKSTPHKSSKTSGFYPQTNGQTERINAELEKYLRLYVDWAQDDWVD